MLNSLFFKMCIIVLFCISAYGYSLSSSGYILSKGGNQIYAAPEEIDEDATTYEEHVFVEDLKYNTDDLAFIKIFEPNTYICYRKEIGAKFIFYTNLITVEYKDKREKIKKMGTYTILDDKANFTLGSSSSLEEYEIVPILNTHDKKFEINIIIDDEYELFCKARKK